MLDYEMSLRCRIVLDVGIQPNGDLMMLITMRGVRAVIRGAAELKWPTNLQCRHTITVFIVFEPFSQHEVKRRQAGKGGRERQMVKLLRPVLFFLVGFSAYK